MNQIAPAAIARLTSEVSKLHGPCFVGVTYRSKESGELARHTFILGASYENVLKNSMEKLTKELPSLDGLKAIAAGELIKSFSKSLLHLQTGTENPAYTQAGMWKSICPGLRIDSETGKMQIAGLSYKKTVIEAGVFKPDTRRELTVAKDELKKDLPAGKYRTLSIEPDALESVRIGGNEIEVAA